MHNVFPDPTTTIKADNSTVENVEKLKRHAFIFINAEPNSSKTAIGDLKQIEGVIELYPSRGAYDIIAKVSGESLKHLREVVLKNMKNLKSIKSTLTLMIS